MIIKNGRLALAGASDFIKADIEIKGGVIYAIEPSIDTGNGDSVVDAEGLLVFPGAIDPHVHFDEPGFTEREDFYHGTSEAARGGVTTVIDMPCTSLPPVTTMAAFENKLDIVSKSAVVDFALFGGVSGHEAEASLSTHMAQLAPFVVGFKTYFISGMETFTSVNHYQFAKIIKEGARLGRPILLHAEDLNYVTEATKSVKAARGKAQATWEDYVASRPEAAELTAAASALALAKGNERTLHVVHVGTSAAAELLAHLGASCETCTHYLAFSSDDFASKGSSLKTAPPVKSRGEAEKLMSLLSDGTISFVASDHAPASEQEKHSGSVWTDYGGIPGTGTLFPWLLSEGFLAGKLTLSRFLETVSGNAAARYGLVRKGAIAPGKDADLVFVDPKAETTLSGNDLLSKGKITPFDGMKLTGRVVKTFVRGILVYEADRPSGERIAAKPGTGKFKRWGA